MSYIGNRAQTVCADCRQPSYRAATYQDLVDPKRRRYDHPKQRLPYWERKFFSLCNTQRYHSCDSSNVIHPIHQRLCSSAHRVFLQLEINKQHYSRQFGVIRFSDGIGRNSSRRRLQQYVWVIRLPGCQSIFNRIQFCVVSTTHLGYDFRPLHIYNVGLALPWNLQP